MLVIISHRLLTMGAVQYWNQGYKVTSEKREDARGCDLHAYVQLCIYIHLFILHLVLLLREDRLSGGQSIQNIGQGQ